MGQRDADTTTWETEAMPPLTPRFLTLADVAEVLNVTVRQVYALVRSGDLRGIQIGGRGQWRIEAVELEDYISRQYARADNLDHADDVTSDR
ncbi:helix-turn-helix domain-containing protein [Aeromicrobium sp.]|uniref:helix-turn-helix domain-containing protein n=1 Tax=Aeromicrobium sp. TaxID=1871063 RepID=UPI003FA557E7